MLEALKNKIGDRCTFVSYLKDKVKNENGVFLERVCLKIVLKNNLGGKDSLIIQLNENTTLEAILKAIKNYENEGS